MKKLRAVGYYFEKVRKRCEDEGRADCCRDEQVECCWVDETF